MTTTNTPLPSPPDDSQQQASALTLAAEWLRPTKLAWHETARDDQLPPPGTWRTWFVRGGRGGGKTWTGALTLASWAAGDRRRPGEWGVVAPTYDDVTKTCVEGESGVLAALGTTAQEARAGKSKLVQYWHPTDHELRLRNGAVIRTASVNDGGLRIQGKNFKGIWCDEVGLWNNWETAWKESIRFAVRKGNSRIVATATPKHARQSRALIRMLLDDPRVPVSTLTTESNADNLSDEFLADVIGDFQGTRLERQELYGEMIDGVEGALWTPDLLERTRVMEHEPAFWFRKVVALDPAGSTEESDEQGLCVVGHSAETHELYVLQSEGHHLPLWKFLEHAVKVAQEHEAMIVLERDAMDAWGVMLRRVIEENPPSVYMKAVRPGLSKRTRAEPVAAIFEQGRAHLVGHHGKLEDQLCSFTGIGREKSPDRLDAMVHACTEFAGHDLRKYVETSDTEHGALSYSDEPVTGGAVAWS